MRKRNLIIANWKMNPETAAEAKALFQSVKRQAAKLKKTDIVICPSFTHVSILSKMLGSRNIFLGAQNTHEKNFGSFTGEVSGNQLKDLRVRYVILGHSERRKMGETDETVNTKLKNLLNLGMMPVVCIGEKERDREGLYLNFVKDQLMKCLSGIEKKDLLDIIICYEPAWAIGKTFENSLSATDMHEMSIFIRKILSDWFGKDFGWNVKLIYGGSVEPANAREMMEKGEVAGLLVGHASLVPADFREILKSVDSIK